MWLVWRFRPTVTMSSLEVLSIRHGCLAQGPASTSCHDYGMQPQARNFVPLLGKLLASYEAWHFRRMAAMLSLEVTTRLHDCGMWQRASNSTLSRGILAP